MNKRLTYLYRACFVFVAAILNFLITRSANAKSGTEITEVLGRAGKFANSRRIRSLTEDNKVTRDETFD